MILMSYMQHVRTFPVPAISRSLIAVSDTGLTNRRNKNLKKVKKRNWTDQWGEIRWREWGLYTRTNRSYKASSSSLSGSSFDAATTAKRGIVCRLFPLSNLLSLRIVNNEFNIAEFALNISSRNATEAVGRYPFTVVRNEQECKD